MNQIGPPDRKGKDREDDQHREKLADIGGQPVYKTFVRKCWYKQPDPYVSSLILGLK
jgi:hypothetical protein